MRGSAGFLHLLLVTLQGDPVRAGSCARLMMRILRFKTLRNLLRVKQHVREEMPFEQGKGQRNRKSED